MNHRSLAFRLGAWYTLLLSATFVVVGAGTFYGLQQYLRSNLRDSLKRRSAQLEQILLQAPPAVTMEDLAREIETRLLPELSNRYVRVTRPPSELVFQSGPPADRSFDPLAVNRGVASGSGAAQTPGSSIRPDLHMMLVARSIDTLSGPYALELGVSTAAMEAALDRLIDFMALLLPLLIACAAGGAYWLVSWALRPVDRISQSAERISLQNLSLRLPVVPSGDALERLSISMNNMLGRLRDSVQTSRRFLADASHELRTPLTVIKGELQEIVSEPELNAKLREGVGSVLEEVGRLEHLVSGLLVLSRLDSGETQRDRADVDLAELARSTAEQMRLMADDRGLGLDLSGLRTAVVRGDRGRLKQIVVNLLDNAIRFTPGGGTITCSTGSIGWTRRAPGRMAERVSGCRL